MAWQSYPVQASGGVVTVPGVVAMSLDSSGAAQPLAPASISHVLTTASTNARLVKASPARVFGWSFGNTTASWRFVRLFNLATLPVPGTSTPAQTIAIPPNGAVNVEYVAGLSYPTGLGLDVTGASPDLDATATGVGDVVGDLFYQ